MVNTQDYELVPVKPLQDIKNELKELRKSLGQKEDVSKAVTKILNSNIVMQHKFAEMLKRLDAISTNLKNLLGIFDDLEVDEKEVAEDEAAAKELSEKFEDVASQSKQILDRLDLIEKKLERENYFKERIPKNIPLVYRRTK